MSPTLEPRVDGKPILRYSAVCHDLMRFSPILSNLRPNCSSSIEKLPAFMGQGTKGAARRVFCQESSQLAERRPFSFAVHPA